MTERYCDLACRVTAMVYKGPVNRVETLSQVSCRLLESNTSLPLSLRVHLYQISFPSAL
jgi:hypothetical protein